MLNQDTITIGKYKGQQLSVMLKDRGYCTWIRDQDWFKTNYEYLYNRVTEYDPLTFFLTTPKLDITSVTSPSDFVNRFEYFNLNTDITLPLTDTEKICYSFYRDVIQTIKTQLQDNITNNIPNPYDIKTPNKWLIKFESDTNLDRTIFKDFLASYDLPNIPTLIEIIKKVGGITYNGARSYIIASEKSKSQEKYWETILKAKYGEDIGTQFKYEKCIFDFIHIKRNIIYECKLAFKDFVSKQYTKYVLTLNKYNVIYLISTDCIVDIKNKAIYSSQIEKHQASMSSASTEFLDLIKDFIFIEIESVEEII